MTRTPGVLVRSGSENRLWSARVISSMWDAGVVMDGSVPLKSALADASADVLLLNRGKKFILPSEIRRGVRIVGAGGNVLTVDGGTVSIKTNETVEFENVKIRGAIHVVGAGMLRLNKVVMEVAGSGASAALDVEDGYVVVNDLVIRGDVTTIYGIYIVGGNNISRIVSMEYVDGSYALSVYNGDGHLWSCVAGAVEVRP